MRRAGCRRDSGLRKASAKPVAVRGQALATPGFFVDQPDRHASGLDLGGCQGTGEDEAPRRIHEKVAKRCLARDEGAEGTNRLSKGAHQDVDFGEDTGGLCGAATARPEDSRGVGVIEQHHGVGLVRALDDLGDGGDVAIHAVDTIDRDEDAARPCAHLAESFGEGVHIAVAEDRDLGACESRAVDDRRMIQFVRYEHVVGTDQGGDDAQIRHVARVEGQRRFASEELRELHFERLMDREIAADEARPARSTSPIPRTTLRRFDDFRMARQVEIITARKEQNLPAVDDHARTL